MISILSSILLIVLSYFLLLQKYDKNDRRSLTFSFLLLLVSPFQFLPLQPTNKSYAILILYSIIFIFLSLFIYISEKTKNNNTYKNLLAIINAIAISFALRFILKIFGIVQ